MRLDQRRLLKAPHPLQPRKGGDVLRADLSPLVVCHLSDHQRLDFCPHACHQQHHRSIRAQRLLLRSLGHFLLEALGLLQHRERRRSCPKRQYISLKAKRGKRRQESSVSGTLPESKKTRSFLMYRLRDMDIDDKVCEQVEMTMLSQVYP
jgi:hypothetical protein